ncbi:uncharacterized protein Dvir_GJ12177 [Drosophila virilis]|uniref:Uncharacterized protein n=2 Tax=Drosophila virilis TaxID=7244 RepID=B4LFV6_DROVI|nr:uncharacterized protein Dvir_GJ12177 [Drosophila virilis]
MATQNETPIVSPATTYCSELEYLIGLQTEEWTGSQPRRSQRLRERQQTAQEDSLVLTETTAGAGSPQLFSATDDEFSQLAQLPPNCVTPSNSFSKRAPGKRLPPGRRNIERKKRRSQSPSKKKRGRQKKQPKAATTTQSEPLPGKMSQLALDSQHSVQMQPSNPLAPSCKSRSLTSSGKRRRRIYKEPDAVSMQRNGPYETQTLISHLQPSVGSQKPSALAPKNATARGQSKPTSGTQRRRTHNKSQSAQILKIDEPKPLIMSSCAGPEQGESYLKRMNSNWEASVIPTATGAATSISSSTQTLSYQCMNLTQTLLPERYPAHFIHQLPTEPKYITGTIIPDELQRVNCGTPANESVEMSCEPIAGREMYSPSPPNAESSDSRTPSLSESLAEVFGTKIIRDVLNIATPRIYRLHEVHLPVVAFMLGVEPGRLRSVLELTQRLSLEQLQQLAQESLELISVNSYSDEETELIEKPSSYKLTTKS